MKFSNIDMAGNAKNVTNADFVVVDGILKEYKGKPVDVIIPDDVTSIGAEGFEYRTDLTNITIPSSVKSIDREAFEGCYKLIEVCNKSNLEIGSCGYR
ncbi:MAG: leucine-rich repeat protein, partial [Clostridiales bacterium]|nr:leucine-rich repeat protein [Clostridiales bacterium]